MAVQGGGPGGSIPARVRFDAIGQAWRLFLADAGTWIVASFIALVIIIGVAVAASVVASLFTGAADALTPGMDPAAMVARLSSSVITQLFVGVFTTVAVLVATAGFYRMAFRRMRGEQINAGELLNVGDVFPQLLVAGVLVHIIVSIGTLLCIVPGIIAAGLLMFTVPLIVERQMDAVSAISTSFRALGGDAVMAVVFYVVLTLISSAGILACCVGLLVTFPLYFLGVAFIYRDFFPDQGAGQYGPVWP